MAYSLCLETQREVSVCCGLNVDRNMMSADVAFLRTRVIMSAMHGLLMPASFFGPAF